MSGSTMGNRGLSVLFLVFMLSAVAAMGLAAAMITESQYVSTPGVLKANANYYSALSGLQWAAQATEGFTTANKDDYLSLNNTRINYNGASASGFTIQIGYLDDDDDSATSDIVTITSTGSTSDPAGALNRRSLTMITTVPAPGGAAIFEDDFDQPDLSLFDQFYQAGATAMPHGEITPYSTGADSTGGDTSGFITHSSETGGAVSILKAGNSAEVRFIISAESCVKWNTLGAGAPCAYQECENRPDCEARRGIDIPADPDGYQNYFIKIRARLLYGDGFGVYFRAVYPNQDDPNSVDFGGLSGYIWQYDYGLGYIAPCDTSTAVFGNDAKGMLAGWKIAGGSETCAGECGVFSEPNPPIGSGSYPFFCPENRTGLSSLNGWRWGDNEWLNRWRSVYIYVYKNRANVYLLREETGATDPEHVGLILLGSIGTMSKTGGIGIRVLENASVEIDYIKIYLNDDDNDPDTFSGS
ncbi:hypothetical protein MNBD_NITROSPINAE03-1695 [hydrothermal vent metagenome]|uniref:Uncharacterized protein n=1 Tax=hydrothermal vent metagenome TaxID=652676 RepID=A0A3B1C510_9ZZZZ